MMTKRPIADKLVARKKYFPGGKGAIAVSVSGDFDGDFKGAFDAAQKSAAERDDEFQKIKDGVKRRYEAFDKKRAKLIAAYQGADTTGTQLKALAAVMRQHGEYVNQGLMAGWQTESILTFADHVEQLADRVIGEEKLDEEEWERLVAGGLSDAKEE